MLRVEAGVGCHDTHHVSVGRDLVHGNTQVAPGRGGSNVERFDAASVSDSSVRLANTVFHGKFLPVLVHAANVMVFDAPGSGNHQQRCVLVAFRQLVPGGGHFGGELWAVCVGAQDGDLGVVQAEGETCARAVDTNVTTHTTRGAGGLSGGVTTGGVIVGGTCDGSSCFPARVDTFSRDGGGHVVGIEAAVIANF